MKVGMYVLHECQVLPCSSDIALWCRSWKHSSHTHDTEKTWARSQKVSTTALCISGWSRKSLAFPTYQTSPLQNEDTEIDQCEGILPTGSRLENKDASEVLREVRF